MYFIFKTEAAECPAIFCKNGASNILSLRCKKMEILFERTHSLGHKFNNALNSFFVTMHDDDGGTGHHIAAVKEEKNSSF